MLIMPYLTACLIYSTSTFSESEWADWSSWSGCTVSCGGGSQVRIRSCRTTQCLGSEVDTIPCNTNRCDRTGKHSFFNTHRPIHCLWIAVI